MRSRLLAIGLVSLALVSCASIPTAEEANDAVLTLRTYGSWAWALGIALIWADIVLPVPQTSVIAALGIIYGTLLGGLLGSLALQLHFSSTSESMGDHDSGGHGWREHRLRRRLSCGHRRCGR